MKKFTLGLIVFTLLICNFSKLNAQNISFATSVFPELTVCAEAQEFTVEITNDTSIALTGMATVIDFPVGIEYVAGSVVETTPNSTYGVVEQSISNLSSVVFAFNSLPADSTVTFKFNVRAGFGAIATQQSGVIFRNTVTVNYNGGSSNTQTDPYNILFGALSITAVDKMVQNVFVGGIFTREITVVNGGFGRINSFTLKDIYDSNLLELLGTDVGVLNGNKDEITVSTTDFNSVGNGDDWFDLNESIKITETIYVPGCSDLQSELYVFWGCDNQTTISNKKFPFTNVSLYAPNIKATAIPSFNTCLDINTPDEQAVMLINSGSGPANDLQFTVQQTKDNGYDQGVFSRIEPSSFTYQTGLYGSETAITPTSTNNTTNTGALACLGASAKGKAILDLPVIQPGDTLIIKWDSYTCDNITECGRVDLIGWDYKVTYTDMCNSKTYTKNNQTGQVPQRKSFGIFAEFPSDMTDGQTEEFSFRLTSTLFEMPEGTDAHFSVKFDIPQGLVWSGNNSDLEYVGNNTTWSPSLVNYDNVTRRLEAHYRLPEPFSLLNSEFHLDLAADCSQLGGSTTVGVDMQLFYEMDSTCIPASEIPLTCLTSTTTLIHCPGGNCVGMGFNGFDVARTSFGSPDNDLDGKADASGSLNASLIKDNRVMAGDTFATTFNGTIHTNGTFPNWQYAYATSSIPNGNEVTLMGATLTVVKNVGGATLTCNNVSFTDAVVSGERVANFDISVATLQSQGCTDFNGFLYEDGDQVTLVANYVVSGNIGATVEQITITNNEYYVSDIANPVNSGDKYQCDTWNGNLTMIGYEFSNYNTNNWNVNNCTRNVHQFFRFRMGNGPETNNLFPYEYRSWASVNQVRIEVPSGYTVTNGRFYQNRTRYTNVATSQNENNLTPVSITPTGNGSSYVYDISQLYANGDILYSDDGFNGYMRLTVKATCTKTTGTNEDLEWYYTFDRQPILGGGQTTEFAPSTHDKIRYTRGNVTVSAIFQTVDVTDPVASWDIKVKNNNGAPAANTFLAFNSPTINVVEVLDNGTPVTVSNGIFQLGTINKNQTKNYTVRATYNQCNLDQLDVYTGYDCDGYPTDFASFNCGTSTYPLYLNPEPSELQVRIDGSSPPNACDPRVTIEVDMLSSKLAHVKDLFVNVQVPPNGSLTLEADSTAVDYPYNTGYASIAEPSIDGVTYTFTGAELDAAIAEGLVGITNPSANRIRLKFNLFISNDFQSGDRAIISVGGKRPCGLDLPTTMLAYDPSATFNKEENGTVGLAGTENNWATAFGDYDNDGNVDLFLVNYEINGQNQLYHNNGDGTFSRVTTGSPVTDIASSTSAVWGDYDNDGDLDLYVSNNIGYNNFLYRNNGDGTFTSIQNDPIVNYNGYSHGAAWADYDNDGFLDMFVADFFPTRFNKLYHNNGDGTFEEVTTGPLVTDPSFSVSCSWGDYDNDGDQDLFVANTNDENNFLYRNDGGNFVKITTGVVVNDGGKSTGASWADIDNDLDLDLFVANAGGQNNFLYTNNGDGSFTKVTTGDIVNDGGNSHGSGFADIDNDGDIDLLVTNDAGENNFLYSNNGDGTFTSIDNSITQDGGKSFGAAWADIDNDYDVDLFISNHDAEENFLYTNERGKCANKACLTFVGTNTNRSAYGTKIKVLATIDGTPTWQMREITSLTGGGIGGQSDQRQLIGIGDATQVDSIIVEWNSGFVQRFGPTTSDSCMIILEEDASKVCGKVFYDRNQNCTQEAGEDGIPNTTLLVQPGNRQIFTDENGDYEINLAPGTYTIERVNGNVWAQNCPADNASLTVNVIGIGNEFCGNDFADTAACQLPDLQVGLATTSLRVGFESLYAISCANKGSENAPNTVLSVDFGPHILPVSASLPWDTTTGNVYTWNLGTLNAGEEFTIFVEDTVLITATIGDDITVTANLNGDLEDCNSADNAVIDINEAVGAIDPNDILVSPEGLIPNDQELTYRIRFQNVGNDLVNTVVLRDELPEELDMTTLVRGVASHAYRFEIQGERTLVWTFDNINLPDSTTNEPESHGFATFRIKLKEGLPDGTEIPNTALIFFDNSDPIQTNTVVNTIGEPGTIKPGDLAIFPNPMSSYANIRIVPRQETNIPEELQRIGVYSITGQLMLSRESLSGRQLTINRGQLEAGYYIVRAVSNKGNIFVGKLIIH